MGIWEHGWFLYVHNPKYVMIATIIDWTWFVLSFISPIVESAYFRFHHPYETANINLKLSHGRKKKEELWWKIFHFRALFCCFFTLLYSTRIKTIFLDKGAFTNYIYKICLFWPPTPVRLHFLWYKSLRKVDFFDHLPPTSCKRSLWMAP